MLSFSAFTLLLASGLIAPVAAGRSARLLQTRDGPSPALPYAPDTSTYCSWWVDVRAGTTCDAIANENFISLEQFKRWNPSLAATCAVEVGKSYCVEAYGEPAPGPSTTSSIQTSTTLSTKTSTSTPSTSTQPPTTTVKPSSTTKATTTTTTGNGITTPTPTQATIVNNCDAFYFVVAGDTCDAISAKHGITVAQFQSWNPSVGTTCTGLWANAYACVSIIGHTPSPTTPGNGITTPTPTQATIVTNCDAFYFVVAGDTCETIASKHGITVAQFRSWNPSAGTTCTGLWANAYACVSIVGHTPTKPSTTTTKPGNGIATPTPIQPNLVGNCDRFYKVKSGDTCATIASSNGITVQQITTWNPAVKSDCTALWLDYYICTSIVGHTPTTPGNGIQTPTPIQSGMTTSCKTFHFVTSGQTCQVITARYGITQANFFKWNPAVKSDCTGMWANAYVCVAVL
ncbi:LysM domain-containing protein [Colletotrichum truncatum]|uniref:LysM domain-containing protein n=1 Tax=Colletotrichum truncatum TaxID=5467 RepID=A0ACC3YEC5_COLTU|nr:LysM domain-containing protein [Colletotrichum truncatum]KAF6790122.1 LysM domain-containing protein [Colletotrichum truncatum]